MTKEERELFDEKIKGIYAAIDANANVDNEHYNSMTQVLDRIEKQTIKTNGSVARNQKHIEDLRIKNIEHLINCPVIHRVDRIDTDLMEYKMMKKYPKFFIIGMVLFGIAIIGSYLVRSGVI